MAEDFSDLNVNTDMTAGEILRAARTTGRRKREIQTIAKQLCIREEFLTALEDGDYTVLPETVYILGFARNYAMELGLDPDMIVTKIKKELGIVPHTAPIAHPVQPERHEVTAKADKESFSKKIKKIKTSTVYKFLMKYWVWFALGLALVVALVVVLMLTKSTVHPHTAPITEIKVVNPEPAYQQPVRDRFGTENRDTAEIVLQAIKESWVKIEDARGKTLFSRVLVPGDIYYVPVGAKNKATFGNAGGIDVWVRGTLVPHVGEDNTRKNGIVLDPDALAGETKAD